METRVLREPRIIKYNTTMTEGQDTCQLCGRAVAELTEHHLIPRTRHSNRRNKRDFSRDEVKQRTLMLCGPCHDTIHATFSNKELERVYNTRESLLHAEPIRRFVRWVRRQPAGTQPRVRTSNTLRRQRGQKRR
jgi:hypothetical protein